MLYRSNNRRAVVACDADIRGSPFASISCLESQAVLRWDPLHKIKREHFACSKDLLGTTRQRIPISYKKVSSLPRTQVSISILTPSISRAVNSLLAGYVTCRDDRKVSIGVANLTLLNLREEREQVKWGTGIGGRHVTWQHDADAPLPLLPSSVHHSNLFPLYSRLCQGSRDVNSLCR